MKKILFIINSLKCGGAERLLLDILHNFDYDKYEVSLLTFNDSCMFKDVLSAKVKRLRCLGFGSRIDHLYRKLLNIFGLLDKYYKSKIKRITGRYDTIVSFLEGFPLRAHTYIINNAKRNITFVHTDLSVYRDSIVQFGNAKNMVAAYKMMSNVIFVSEGALKGFEKVYGNILTHKQVIHNFIDIEAIMQKAKLSGTPYSGKFFNIVLLGRVTEIKGYDIIPDIASMLKSNNLPIRFTIVGDGGYMPILKQLLRESSTEDMVSLVGFQPNPYPYLKNADLFFSTSKTEGLPISFCEAMAFGVPILSTPTTGALELLADGTGIIVSRNVKELYDAIIEIYKNKKLLANLSSKSKTKAGYFSKEKYLEKLYSVI